MDKRPGYNRSDYWKDGDLSALAEAVGVDLTDVSAIIHRRRGVSLKKARALSEAAALLGYDIPWAAFIDNRNTNHPAFYGGPRA